MTQVKSTQQKERQPLIYIFRILQTLYEIVKLEHGMLCNYVKYKKAWINLRHFGPFKRLTHSLRWEN